MSSIEQHAGGCCGLRHRLHDAVQVVLEDFLLVVSHQLELPERLQQIVGAHRVPDLPKLHAQRMAARVLAHHQLALRAAHRLRRHDLVGGRVLQDAVLVDARLVREGVPADDRLVRLRPLACELGQQVAGGAELGRVNLRLKAGVEVLADLQRHHDFFQRGVPCPLANAVDAPFYLPGAGLDRCQRVRHGHAQVIVAVHGDDRLVRVFHLAPDTRDQLAELVRHHVADGVRDVDRRGTRLDDGLDHFVQVVPVRARGVHRRELDIGAILLGPCDHRNGPLLALLPADAELLFQVDI